jgi:broad specificity phosphatase PhoE
MRMTEAGPDEGPAFVAPEVPEQAELWLLRHGETEWSVSGQHTGRTDIPLTDAGEDQARAMGALLGDLSPALVLSSPRRRAVDTARLAGLKVDETTEDLAEWNYGEYEGRTTDEIRERDPGWTVWTSETPGGETRAEIAARADRVLTRAAGALAEGPVVLVGHGHFSRVLAARWIGLPVSGGAHLLLGTAAPSQLSAQYGVPVIERWNLPNPAA